MITRVKTMVASARRIAVIALILPTLLLGACARRVTETPAPLETVTGTQTAVKVRPTDGVSSITATPRPSPTPAYVSRINAPPGTLVYPLRKEPLSLDPQEAVDVSSTLVVQQLYEGLFRLRADGTVVTAAASGYEVSPDSKTYTVTLRTGMHWSDGQPLTAQHFVDGLCRALAPALNNPDASLLVDTAQVMGAAGYASGETTGCGKVGLRAPDPLTLRIDLAQPFGILPAVLASRPFMPARISDGDPGQATGFTNASPVNGPYQIARWTPGERIELTKNPRYWNQAEVLIKQIDFRIVPDLSQQLELYEQGELQVAELTPDSATDLLTQPGIAAEVRVLNRPGVSFLGLNTRAGPTADANFRRAIASAIDREALLREMAQEPWHTPAERIIPPGVLGTEKTGWPAVYRRDQEAVSHYLAAAGFTPDNPPPSVEIWGNREGNNETLLQAVASTLESAGIPVRLVTSDWDTYVKSLDVCKHVDAATSTECTYHVYRMGWISEYADASALLDKVFGSDSALQYSGWQSESYQIALADALREPDPAKRAGLYRAAEGILLEEAVVIPILYYSQPVLVKAGLDYQYPPVGAPSLHTWQLRYASSGS